MDASAWQRAWQDAEHVRESGVFFWGIEVIGAAFFGGISAVFIIPADPTRNQQIFLPVLGIVTGFVAVYVTIFVWQFARAPYRQRDEARMAWRGLREQADRQRGHREETVSTFLREGRDIVASIRRSNRAAEIVVKRAQPWVDKVYGWLTVEVPTRAEEFLVEGFPVQMMMDGRSLRHSEIANLLDRRLWRLKEIHDGMIGQ